MFAKHRVVTTIPAADLERAKKFYSDKLGLRPEKETPGGIYYKSKDTIFLLYPTKYAGTAKHTVASWETDNLERDMKDMRNKGIVFEEYDMPGLKTINGVAMMDEDKVAWFKDSEGNILSIAEVKDVPK